MSDRRETQGERLTPSADTTMTHRDAPRPDTEVHTTSDTGGSLPDPDFGLQNTDGKPDVAYGNTEPGRTRRTRRSQATSGRAWKAWRHTAAARTRPRVACCAAATPRAGPTVENNLPHGMGDEDPGGTMAQGTTQAPMGSGDVAPPDPATATNQGTFTEGMRGTARDTPER